MNSTVNKIAAVAIALAAAVPAFAGTQVVAGNGVTLTEAAQAKFNRDTRPDDRHPIVVPGQASGNYGQLAAAAGLTAEEAQGLSLNEIYVAKINREARGDDKQAVKGGQVTMGTRSAFTGTSNVQLIAVSGLSSQDAAGMSLTEIAAAKFARDTDTDDK